MVPVSRRHLLRLGQACLTAAALPEVMFSAPTADALSMSKDGWLPLLLNSFTIHSDATNPTWLTLVSVTDMNSVPDASFGNAPKVDTFVLRFQAVGEALPQGTYELTHSSQGKISLFIVPAGEGAYSAIISQLLSTPSGKTGDWPVPAGRSRR